MRCGLEYGLACRFESTKPVQTASQKKRRSQAERSNTATGAKSTQRWRGDNVTRTSLVAVHYSPNAAYAQGYMRRTKEYRPSLLRRNKNWRIECRSQKGWIRARKRKSRSHEW